jgi:ABC-type Fe3+/spermidine/putrescine transport system ATPase subunit
MTLRLEEVSVSFDGRPILKTVSLLINTGETVALTGRSGSGKSTLLKVIAGLLPLESGRVMWDSTDLTHMPTYQRQVGMVFQDRLLFPHLNVGENVAFGLRYSTSTSTSASADDKSLNHKSSFRLPFRSRTSPVTKERVHELLELVGLAGFERRAVATLSGGEAQRVALARALAPKPRVLLLDEPFGALDLELRRELTAEVRQLLRHEAVTAIHVTHDPEEAAAVADRVIDMSAL